MSVEWLGLLCLAPVASNVSQMDQAVLHKANQNKLAITEGSVRTQIRININMDSCPGSCRNEKEKFSPTNDCIYVINYTDHH